MMRDLTPDLWAPSVNKHGWAWHFVAQNGAARCYGSVKLDLSRAAKEPSGSACSRCLRFADSHRATQTPEYKIWIGIIVRCENTKSNRFPRYGGRGIKVCERWRISFPAFLNDMGIRPSPKHSIDRIDNDGNYELGNCRWATDAQQRRNRSDTRLITAFDRTQCLADWAAETGIDRLALHWRLKHWTPEEAISRPLRGYAR